MKRAPCSGPRRSVSIMANEIAAVPSMPIVPVAYGARAVAASSASYAAV